MGIFFEQVEVVNRTCERLEVVYDGQRIYIEPNYDENGNRLEGVQTMIPRVALPFALNQTCIPGSESVTDPSRFRSYLGVVDPKAVKAKKRYSWLDCSYVDKAGNTEITRVAQEAIFEEYVGDETKRIVVKGKKAPKHVDVVDGVGGAKGDTTPFELRAGVGR